jgi:cardiolipin synthase
LAIFFTPYLGIGLFLLVGTFRLPKKRREKQTEINHFIHDGRNRQR